MAQQIVTKAKMMNLLTTAPASFDGTLEDWQRQVIGRALVAIFQRQTASERSANTTSEHNNIGFAGCDAKSGSFAAKSYLKRKTLLDFQYDSWMKTGKSGYPRIVKYTRQLNEIALEKAAS